MYYQAIYTHCPRGLDLLRKGQPITGTGFKVYSCSAAVYNDNLVDLPLFNESLALKQPYSDAQVNPRLPELMDEVYSLQVPDNGAPFMICFYPFPLDKGRSGTFVSQALVGEFNDFYPFQTFGDQEVWEVTSRSAAFFSENQPQGDAGKEITALVGRIGFAQLAAFIADGRQKALRDAVSFIIEQYEEEPEKRRYLVVQGESSREIELWIAAIEAAFSPRMAAGIPFATRLDRFSEKNAYFVNAGNFAYQAQAMRNNPNYKQRLRAMLVGVDDRDPGNSSQVKPGDPRYVVLSSAAKALLREDAPAPGAFSPDPAYLESITRFDAHHRLYVQGFLQLFRECRQPRQASLRYQLYASLRQPAALPPADLVRVLDELGAQIEDSIRHPQQLAFLAELAERLLNELPGIMLSSFPAALSVCRWLISGPGLSDPLLQERLALSLEGFLASRVYGSSNEAQALETRELWRLITTKPALAVRIAKAICEPQIIRARMGGINSSSPEAIVSIMSTFLSCAEMAGRKNDDLTKGFVLHCLGLCHRYRRESTASEIAGVVYSYFSDARGFFLEKARQLRTGSASAAPNPALAEFIVRIISAGEARHERGTFTLLEELTKANYDDPGLLAQVLVDGTEKISTPQELRAYLESIPSALVRNNRAVNELVPLWETLDGKLIISGEYEGVAEILFRLKPPGANCPQAAFLFALKVFRDGRMHRSIAEICTSLVRKGFPQPTNTALNLGFSSNLYRGDLKPEDLFTVYEAFCDAPQPAMAKPYLQQYLALLLTDNQKGKGAAQLNALFTFAAGAGPLQAARIYEGCLSVIDSWQQSPLNLIGSLGGIANLLEGEKERRSFYPVFGEAMHHAFLAQRSRMR